MRQAIGPILGPRALLPQADLGGTLQRLRVLTPAGKAVAELELRSERPLRFGQRSVSTGSLRLIAEPDQAVQAAGLRQRLMTSLGLMPLGEGDALTALAACGVRPLDQSAGMEIRIESPMAAETAAKQILRGLLATLKVNIPGVCRNLDSEFLHDFRVAIRRIRAALSQLRRALSPRVGERLRREFTWLGQLTSNARDLDVFLLAFDDALRYVTTPISDRADLATFTDAHHNMFRILKCLPPLSICFGPVLTPQSRRRTR